MSNLRSARLIMVTAANNNKFYFMDEQADGRIKVEYGRIEKTSKTIYKSAYEWDKVFNAKVKKGYSDMTHLYEKADAIDDASDDKKVKDITNNIVKKLVDELQSYATGVVKKNYSVTSNTVTQAMVDEAQSIIDDIANDIKVGAKKTKLNDKLLELFQVIPRQMGSVTAYLFSTNLYNKDDVENAQKKISKEQDILDSMAGLVAQAATQTKVKDEEKEDTNEMDILQQLGMEITEASDKEYQMVRDMMFDYDGKTNQGHQLDKLYCVVNKKTQTRFDKHVAECDNKTTELLYHGSVNHAWWSILQTGLEIRPAANGSMFGRGLYFADKYAKSRGYSSLRGSYWSGGSDNVAFIALFDVHTGKKKVLKRHTRDCYSYDQSTMDKFGVDSLHALGGADLKNDEYLVYRAEKCTVKYLMRIKK